jgi:hypothetical protein
MLVARAPRFLPKVSRIRSTEYVFHDFYMNAMARPHALGYNGWLNVVRCSFSCGLTVREPCVTQSPYMIGHIALETPKRSELPQSYRIPTIYSGHFSPLHSLLYPFLVLSCPEPVDRPETRHGHWLEKGIRVWQS